MPVSLSKCDFLSMQAADKLCTILRICLAFMSENEIWICTSNVFSDRITKQYPISELAIITVQKSCDAVVVMVNKMTHQLFCAANICLWIKFAGHTFYRQKQTSRRVLSKRCSENMQQIYRRTPTPKCDFNKITLRYGYSPVNLLHVFRTPFSRNISGWLLSIEQKLWMFIFYKDLIKFFKSCF